MLAARAPSTSRPALAPLPSARPALVRRGAILAPAAAASGPSSGLKELGAAVAAATGVPEKTGMAAARAVLEAIEENVSERGVFVMGLSTSVGRPRWRRVGRGGARRPPKVAAINKNACAPCFFSPLPPTAIAPGPILPSPTPHHR